MKLTILGKYGPYPKAGACCSGYLVESNGSKIVMDMGAGTLSRLLSLVDIREVDAIILTHLHYDHTSDLLPLRYLLEEISHDIKIYAHTDDSEWCKILLNHKNFLLTNIDEDSVIDVGGNKISFFLMNHSVANYAIKIRADKTLAYTGDTMYTDKIYDLMKGADVLLADCAKPYGFGGPHMNIANATSFAENKNVKIIATHWGAGYDPTEDLKGYENIILPEEMATYEI